MEELLRELEQSQTLRAFLRSRVPNGPDGTGCAPNCKWILDDLEANGKLTGYPKDYNGVSDYPVSAKILHLYAELIGCVPEVDDPMELLPALLAKIRTIVWEN